MVKGLNALETLVVIGQGYVGLPLASAASGAGYRVMGLDLNLEVVTALNAGRSHIDDMDDVDIKRMLEHGYRATQDGCVIGEADVVAICVPTPLSDLSWLSVVVSGFLVAVGRGFVLAGGTNWGLRRR